MAGASAGRSFQFGPSTHRRLIRSASWGIVRLQSKQPERIHALAAAPGSTFGQPVCCAAQLPGNCRMRCTLAAEALRATAAYAWISVGRGSATRFPGAVAEALRAAAMQQKKAGATHAPAFGECRDKCRGCSKLRTCRPGRCRRRSGRRSRCRCRHHRVRRRCRCPPTTTAHRRSSCR